MTKKILSAMLASLLVVSAVSFTANAADEKAFYVEAGASGDGTEDDPFGTIEEAIFALDNKEGTIYIYGEYALPSLKSTWEGMITVSGVNKDSAITMPKSAGVTFNGPITLKDINFALEPNVHLNPNGFPLILDLGEGNEFKSFLHLGVLGNATVDEGYFEMKSGYVSRLDACGGYSTSYANGVAGDNTVVINGGSVGTISFRADRYMDTMTGISIGGNMNLIYNGGTIGQITTDATTAPEIMGALNIIFNNGMQKPEKFTYPEEAAAGGNFIIMSAEGGMITPTEEVGVFEVKADKGKIAKIDGKEVLNGKVTLEAGETEVTWVSGDQPEPVEEKTEIKLTIGDANIITNGESKALDVPAQLIDNRTMVPLRAIFEALGASVEWDGDTKTVTSVKGDTTVKLTVGEKKLTVNGTAKELDVPGQIVENRTLVPVRAISEAFGCEVGWDSATRTVTITK